MSVIGTEASLGANVPDYSYPLPLVFGIEVLATAMLMAVIYLVVYTKGLWRLWRSGYRRHMVGLDIFFFAFISGASMNPARSLAPAVLSGVLGNLWLYWSATFIGSSAVDFVARRSFKNDKTMWQGRHLSLKG
jgi:aquaporin Z